MERNLQHRKTSVLSIGGMDPCGGAGILADVRAWEAMGLHAMAVPTCQTVQNHEACLEVHPAQPTVFKNQLQCLLDGYEIAWVKLGAFPNWELLAVAFEVLAAYPTINIVWDPVLKASHGSRFLSLDKAPQDLEKWLNGCFLITPNYQESQLLLQQLACETWQHTGVKSVVLCTSQTKKETQVTDTLYTPQGTQHFTHSLVAGVDFHGSGCTYTAHIVGYLVQGNTLEQSIQQASTDLEQLFINYHTSLVHA